MKAFVAKEKRAGRFSCALFVLSMASPTSAATIPVTSTNDNGGGSLRQAIQDARPGDTINFSITGTIALTNGALLITNDLSIIGPGATNLAVSGNRLNRVFGIGSNATVSISGLTIKDGRVVGATGTNSTAGPGSEGSLGLGGGILNAGVLTLHECYIIGNSASGGAGARAIGGGIFNSGSLRITTSSLIGNTATGGSGADAFSSQNGRSGPGGSGLGGALYNLGALTIAWSTFSGNGASGGTGGAGGFSFNPGGTGGNAEGGAVCNRGSASFAFNTFSGNSAAGGTGGSVFGWADIDGEPGGLGGLGHGGAIHDSNGVVMLTNNTFAANLAAGGNGGSGSPGAYTTCGAFPPGNGGNGGNGNDGAGGAIFGSGGTVHLRSCTFSRNRATGGLGGSGGSAGQCTVPVFPPQAPIRGAPGHPGSAGAAWSGGLLLTGGANSMQNTLVAGNFASIGADVAGSISSQGHNLIGISNDSSGWVDSDLAGNRAMPLDPKLSPLQNNGGPTLTMALLADSPAIDQGVSSGLTTDQRGRFRPIDKGAVTNAGDGDAGDIGAYEMRLEEFWLTRPMMRGNDLVITFASEVGLRYRIERKDHLDPGSWTVVADDLPGTGRMVEVIDSGATSDAPRFYRALTIP